MGGSMTKDKAADDAGGSDDAAAADRAARLPGSVASGEPSYPSSAARLVAQANAATRTLNDLLAAFSSSDAARALDRVIRGSAEGLAALLRSDGYRALQASLDRVRAALPSSPQPDDGGAELSLPAPPLFAPAHLEVATDDDAGVLADRVAVLEVRVDCLEGENEERRRDHAIANPTWTKHGDGDPS
jgi:hypothetical protein